MDRSQDKSSHSRGPSEQDSVEIQGQTFLKQGYNADLSMPVDIEPVPRDAPGAGLDVRSNAMPEDGVVIVHDDDNDILETEKTSPASE